MTTEEQKSPLLDLVERAGKWIRDHRDEIFGFITWMAVFDNCERSGIYAPANPEAWDLIADIEAEDPAEIGNHILDIYGPGGCGYSALKEELRTVERLKPRRSEIEEILASADDGRFFVAASSTLPLIEGTLASSYGKWQKKIEDYDIHKKLEEADHLSPDEEAELILYASAIEMIETTLPAIWKSTPHRVDLVTSDMYRNQMLHGTSQGWASKRNAVKALLLLAAVGRTAEAAFPASDEPFELQRQR